MLLGNYRPALAVARGLSAEGYRVILSREGDEGGCELSRYVSEVWENPRLEKNEGAFIAGLDELLARRADICAVLPVAEEFVNCLAARRWVPRNGVVLASPEHAVVGSFTDKMKALRMADRAGVATLPFEQVSHRSELMEAARTIGFPITVRPLGTTARLGTSKALIARSKDQLRELLPAWPAGHKTLLLQRFAAGARHNVYFAARSGKLLAVAESRIHRTNHVSGTGLAVSGVTVPLTPALVRDTALLAQDCGYTGIGLAQFILNSETSERCFLELNPRVSGSHAVPERSGVPLSAMAVSLAKDEPIAIPDPYLSGRTGIRYVWATGEIIGLKARLRQGDAGVAATITAAARVVRDALSADLHIVWSWRDPKPGLRALWHLIPKFHRVRRRKVTKSDRQAIQIGKNVS